MVGPEIGIYGLSFRAAYGGRYHGGVTIMRYLWLAMKDESNLLAPKGTMTQFLCQHRPLSRLDKDQLPQRVRLAMFKSFVNKKGKRKRTMIGGAGDTAS